MSVKKPIFYLPAIVLLLIVHRSFAFEDIVGEFDHRKALIEIVKSHGYPFELHHILSYDGYILEMHRFPGKGFNEANKSTNPPAVLIMHGLLGSSADFIVSGPKKGLAFILHDEGYDVWLGNSRGNMFSRNHTTLSTADYAFWDFSWHEIGLYDASAQIDHVRNYTGHDKIFYIGYSQGTTQFWVLMSLKPEYNNRVKFMAALAPAAYMGHVKGLVSLLSRPAVLAKDTYDKNGYFEMLRNTDITRKATSLACKLPVAHSSYNSLCEYLAVLGSGLSDETDYENLGKYLQFAPAGCSCKQLLHYALNIENPGHFRPYDYNEEKNLRLYNSTVPPEYPLHKITVPVGIYNTKYDYLATPEDVILLKRMLPNVVEKYTIKSPKVNHIDFVYGKNMRKYIYDRVIMRMNSLR